MRSIRVLVVDDSAVVRRLVGEILSSTPGVEVVATAANGASVLPKIESTAPDVVTLDIELPDMSGLDVLTQIRAAYPKLPVIMFSALTQRAAATTLEALARGATDYVTKPSIAGSREAAMDQVREQLVTKVKALGEQRGPTVDLTSVRARTASLPPRDRCVEVLAIGTSTGGPNALAEVFRELPALPVPVLIVQHMPPLFTRLLAERLTLLGKIPVREAVDGDILEPGHGWIAPGDFHMRVVRSGVQHRIELDKGPPENSCRPSVDVLFRSVAANFGARCVAAVLTGMGQDGLRGCEDIHAQGGQIVVQDEASSVVWGMPGFVAKAGLTRTVLPLGEIAGDLARRVMASHARPGERRHAV